MMTIATRFGIRYPLIQGGMANIATAQLAAAVSNAGGLGLVGAGGMSVEMLREILANGTRPMVDADRPAYRITNEPSLGKE